MDDLRSFQVVDRHVIIARMHDFLDQRLRMFWRYTSGTSGTPFFFPKDLNATGYMDAAMHTVYGWHGVKIGDKQARLWGGALSAKGRLLQRAKDSLLGRQRLSVFHCDHNFYSRYFNILKTFKPVYFYAYANALYQFALHVEKTEQKGTDLGIPLAICTGEILFPHQRQKISEVFGCRVINEYGSTENGIIAFQCEAGSMHVMPTIYLEIENPDDQGYGHVLVTELNSRSIPFLRYRIGDIARLVNGECSCCRPFPRIEIGKGRVNDQIICPDGSVVYATIISYALKEHAQQFRAVQHSISEIEIEIIPGQEWDIQTQKEIEGRLRRYLGTDITILFSIVKDIPPEKNGKFRYFSSKLGRNS
jgi:phenylacetate-CoA ligase